MHFSALCVERASRFYDAKALNCPLKPSFNCDRPEIPCLVSHGDSAKKWLPSSKVFYKNVLCENTNATTKAKTEQSCLTQPSISLEIQNTFYSSSSSFKLVVKQGACINFTIRPFSALCVERAGRLYNAKALNCPLKPSFNCDCPEIPHLASHGDSAMSW
jgi:hypothetical protein